MQVLIVGAGEMGRWFGRTIDAQVAYADVNDEVAERAATATDGRTVELDTDVTFPVVVIAVPMDVAVEAIETHASQATEAILDLTGVMEDPLTAMRNYELESASLHPLFAADNAPGRIAIATGTPGERIDAIRATLERAGNEFVDTTPEEHDRAMETIQAKAHAAVLAFGLAADEVPEGFGTPVYDGLRDVLEEVTDGSPRVYADIQETFDGADAVAEAALEIVEADRDDFEALYRRAGRAVEHSRDDE